MKFGGRTVLYGITQAMYPDKSIYFKEPTKGFLNAKKQMKFAAEALSEYDKRAVLNVVNNALFGEKMDKETTNAKGRGPLIAKGHEDFSDNEDRNAEGNEDMNTEEDKDINTEEDEDINTEEDEDINTEEDEDIDIEENEDINTENDKDIDTEENEDIDTEENEDCDTTSHKLTAGSEADSDTGSDEFSTPAEPKQDVSPINAGALTKVAKSNTASDYIASIDKLADSVNQSGPSKLDSTPAKDRKNQKAVTSKQEKGRSPATSKMSSSGMDKKRKPRLFPL